MGFLVKEIFVHIHAMMALLCLAVVLEHVKVMVPGPTANLPAKDVSIPYYY